MITIIPAIDIIGGKCVRLTKGDFATKKIYNQDPLLQAKIFEDIGVRRLHLVDLDGARQKHIVNLNVLQKLSGNTSLQIDFGGGVQSNEDIEKAFAAGAQQITAGSIAVRDKDLVKSWILKYGADKIILGADVSNRKIAVSGWQSTTDILLVEFLRSYIDLGIRDTICTDIANDGTLGGPGFALYKQLKKEFPTVQLIASGGVSCIEDVQKLNDYGVDGVIIGKAIYEQRIKLEELKPFLC